MGSWLTCLDASPADCLVVAAGRSGVIWKTRRRPESILGWVGSGPRALSRPATPSLPDPCESRAAGPLPSLGLPGARCFATPKQS